MGAGVLSDREALLHAIADQVGTPVYVYDAGEIRGRFRRLTEALAGIPHRIHYSVKANSNLAVLGVLRRLGAGADIVSVGELERALRAGFGAADMIFSGVGKREDELDQALAAGVGLINVESFEELKLLDCVARRRNTTAAFGIRVNPDVRTATHPYTQTGEEGMKFGVPLDDVPPMTRWAAGRTSLRLDAVGFHIGSQILNAAHYADGAARLIQLIAHLRNQGAMLRSVDAGGGLGIRYRDERPLDLEAYADAMRGLARTVGLPVVIEPGRFLVGPAGLLLGRCLYVKRTAGRTFVILDAAMNDLLRPSLYGAEHDLALVPGGIARSDALGEDETVDVVGPVCETGDFLARDRVLPGVAAGSLVAVLAAGAYGFSMSSSYNSRPRVAEVLVDGGNWAVVRRRETVDDLLRGERTLDEIA
jgi:diaminopimelate decarboxylase